MNGMYSMVLLYVPLCSTNIQMFCNELLHLQMTCGEKAKKNSDCIPCCGVFPCRHACNSTIGCRGNAGIHPKPICLIYGYYSEVYPLFLFDGVVLWVWKENRSWLWREIWVPFCCVCLDPLAELCRIPDHALSWLSSPSAHYTSPWRVLWGGSTPKPWQDAWVHHHARSASELSVL